MEPIRTLINDLKVNVVYVKSSVSERFHTHTFIQFLFESRTEYQISGGFYRLDLDSLFHLTKEGQTTQNSFTLFYTISFYHPVEAISR